MVNTTTKIIAIQISGNGNRQGKLHESAETPATSVNRWIDRKPTTSVVGDSGIQCEEIEKGPGISRSIRSSHQDIKGSHTEKVIVTTTIREGQ